jgi:hypothetical protein
MPLLKTLARPWILKLPECDFEIIYRKIKANINADGISRIDIVLVIKPIQ